MGPRQRQAARGRSEEGELWCQWRGGGTLTRNRINEGYPRGMWGVVTKWKRDAYCLRVIEEKLLWSYYMIIDSCHTRNVMMYDTLSEGKGNNNVWGSIALLIFIVYHRLKYWVCPCTHLSPFFSYTAWDDRAGSIPAPHITRFVDRSD